MARYHLAQLNVGLVRAPADSPELADFMAGIAPVNAMADAEPGFVWRLQDGDGPGATALRPRGPDLMVNMSVWETLEALRDFVYRNGPHLDFMRRRREWFHRMAEEHLVLWWVPAGHIPDVGEGLSRLDLLRANGPSPLAFTFRDPFAAHAAATSRAAIAPCGEADKAGKNGAAADANGADGVPSP
ncbi:MAG TPA: DUF3291 domain-containing protein [Streptosporangiaceae bacterium]